MQCISSLIDRFPLLLIRCFIRSSLLVASSSGSIDLVLSSCLSEMNKSSSSFRHPFFYKFLPRALARKIGLSFLPYLGGCWMGRILVQSERKASITSCKSNSQRCFQTFLVRALCFLRHRAEKRLSRPSTESVT